MALTVRGRPRLGLPRSRYGRAAARESERTRARLKCVVDAKADAEALTPTATNAANRATAGSVARVRLQGFQVSRYRRVDRINPLSDVDVPRAAGLAPRVCVWLTRTTRSTRSNSVRKPVRCRAAPTHKCRRRTSRAPVRRQPCRRPVPDRYGSFDRPRVPG